MSKEQLEKFFTIGDFVFLGLSFLISASSLVAWAGTGFWGILQLETAKIYYGIDSSLGVLSLLWYLLPLTAFYLAVKIYFHRRIKIRFKMIVLSLLMQFFAGIISFSVAIVFGV
jgi:hypothetical protein